MARPPKDIKATRRADRGGRYAVQFLEDPGHWHQSPEAELSGALAWARRNRGRLITKAAHGLHFGEMIRDTFTEGSAWIARQEAKGHTFTDAYMRVRDGHVRNYVIPLFGADDPRELTRRYVDDKLLAASRSGRFGRPLAPATMHKVVYTLNLVLEDLVDRGIVDRNPIEGIRQYSKTPIRPRDALPKAALDTLFPAGHGALVRIWGGPLWAACMCLLLDTGMRPGELRALKWRQIDNEQRFVPVRYGIQAGTTATIKETKTGIVRAAFMTYRTAQELAIWKAESRHAAPDDFVFTYDGDAPITNAAIVKAFRRGVLQAGLDEPLWTPYWLRHSFGTYRLAELEDWEIQMMMGHTNLVTNAIYRHPDDEIVRVRALGIQKKLDEAREP